MGPIGRAIMAPSISEAGSKPAAHEEPTPQTCGLPVSSASASHRPSLCPTATFSSLPKQTVPSHARPAHMASPARRLVSRPPAGSAQQVRGSEDMGVWATEHSSLGTGPPGMAIEGPCGISHSWACYYCDASARAIQDFSLHPCPQGYYCPLGTAMATQHSCPMASYGSRKELRSIPECQLCRDGKFCALAGLKAPTGMSWRAGKAIGSW